MVRISYSHPSPYKVYLIFIWKTDLRVLYLGGRYLVEHKTSGRKGSLVTSPNHQATGYIVGSKAAGYPVDGLIFNVIMIYKDKREFSREIITRTEQNEEEWYYTILDTKADIDKCTEREWFPQFTTNCWNCSYKLICGGDSHSMENVIQTFYKEEPWEPWKTEETNTEVISTL